MLTFVIIGLFLTLLSSFGLLGFLWARMKNYEKFIKKIVSEDFYHKRVKRPICRVNIRIRRSIKNLQHSENDEYNLYIYHNSAVEVSDYTDDPYANTMILPLESKLKFCNRKINEIRKRAHEYYPYTSNRLKKEDIYELCIYRNELEKLKNV